MLACLFLLLAIAVRFMPHPWGFTPVMGSLLFFGARSSRRFLWVPMALLVLCDLALTRYMWAYKFSWDQLLIWAWYAGVLWLGTRLHHNSRPLRIIGAALAGSVSFFLISNFGVWAATAMYSKDFSGLLACYTLAIPFFRRTLEGDLFFTAVMFATPVLMRAIAGTFDRGRDRIAAA